MVQGETRRPAPGRQWSVGNVEETRTGYEEICQPRRFIIWEWVWGKERRKRMGDVSGLRYRGSLRTELWMAAQTRHEYTLLEREYRQQILGPT